LKGNESLARNAAKTTSVFPAATGKELKNLDFISPRTRAFQFRRLGVSRAGALTV
jgi:hypothetical protein